MKRLIFYILSALAFICRGISNKLYMQLIVKAHKSQGVKFNGNPEYIHQDAYLDPTGGLTISDKVVISTKVIVLTHDWSFLKREDYTDREIDESKAFRPVTIGENSFIGAGAILLPGTTIGQNCIIGAGAVVKGEIEPFSIMAGNPAKKISTINHQ